MGEQLSKRFQKRGLADYLKSLRKALKSAQAGFWRDIRAAEQAFHKEMAAAMREYEKAEYSNRRVPGALAEAAKSLNDRYEAAYRSFGNATKEALERFEKKIEDLMGV